MKNFFFIIFCLIGINVQAQIIDEFIKGYYVDLNGNTKNGWIRNGAVRDINNGIIYKETPNDKEIIIKASEISNFRFENGERYTRFYYKNFEDDKMNYILAHNIVTAKLSMYEFYEKSEQMFFLKKDSITYILRNDDLEGTITRRSNYRQLISVMTDDCINKKFEIEALYFSLKEIEKIIRDYNICIGATIETEKEAKQKTVNHLIVGVSGMPGKKQNEIIGYVLYRKYFPKISKGASMNFSLNYFYGNSFFLESVPRLATYSSRIINYNYSLSSLSVYGQENFMNNNFRPYAIIGFMAYNLDEKYSPDTQYYPKGFQLDYGFSYVVGFGIEYNFYRGLMLKSEYRIDLFSHLVNVGIAYNFSYKK